MQIVKNRFIYIGISVVIIIAGIAFSIFNHSKGRGYFNYDIQFTGGTSIEVNIGKNFENDDITAIVKETTGEGSPQVQKVGDGNSVVIKTKSLSSEARVNFVNKMIEKYEITKDDISINDISATISSEMKKNSFLAVGVSCIAMLIYVSVRFRDFKTGASAIIALLHDSLVVLACYAVFRIPLNNSFIAAILTVLGYSINATIVIFDRVRENKRRSASTPNEKLIDTSIMQSMRRSLFTSLTTFFTITALYIFGVESVKEFSLPIVVGVICGTYSSIFIAGSVWYILAELKKQKRSKA